MLHRRRCPPTGRSTSTPATGPTSHQLEQAPGRPRPRRRRDRRRALRQRHRRGGQALGGRARPRPSPTAGWSSATSSSPPGPVRIGTITRRRRHARPGGLRPCSRPPRPTHVVTVDLDATRSDELEPGTKVGLTLPDGTETTGTVATIGAEAEPSRRAERPGHGGGGGPTVPVDDHARRPGRGRRVRHRVGRRRHRAVPGGRRHRRAGRRAARAGRGRLRRRAGRRRARRSLVGVEVGTYADGWVGVTGDGIEPGAEVVVPA